MQQVSNQLCSMSIYYNQEFFTDTYDTTSLDIDGVADAIEKEEMSNRFGIQNEKSSEISEDPDDMTDLNLIHDNF